MSDPAGEPDAARERPQEAPAHEVSALPDGTPVTVVHVVRHGRLAAAGVIAALSFPFFFDPGWDAEILPVPEAAFGPDDPRRTTERGDGASVHKWSGTYGEYLVAKVSKVFPELVHVI